MRYETEDTRAVHVLGTQEEYDGILQRMHEVTNCRDQQVLAAFLEETPENMREARRTLSVPVSWVRKIFLATHASPLWIMHGEGEQYM